MVPIIVTLVCLLFGGVVMLACFQLPAQKWPSLDALIALIPGRRLRLQLSLTLTSWLRQWRQSQEAAKQAQREKVAYGGRPIPLPLKRPRRLSIDDMTPTELGSKSIFVDQSSSSRLFGMLPAEVRLKIWKLALGSDGYNNCVIHLVTMAKRMAHIRCRLSSNRSTSWHRHVHIYQPLWQHACWGQCARDGIHLGRAVHEGREPHDVHFLSLPKTCKQIYAETIDLLYSANTFCVRQSAALPNFVTTLLPQRVQSIRSLRIETAFTGHLSPSHADLLFLNLWHGDTSNTWPAMCRTLQQMTGLQSLRVRLDLIDLERVTLGSVYNETVYEMLYLLATNARPSKVFEVKVHWQLNRSIIDRLRLNIDLPYLLETLQPEVSDKVLVVDGFPGTSIAYSPIAAQRSLKNACDLATTKSVTGS